MARRFKTECPNSTRSCASCSLIRTLTITATVLRAVNTPDSTHAYITANTVNGCLRIQGWPDPDLTSNDTEGVGTGAGSCKSLNYDFGDSGKRCVECGHGKMNHYCWWNKHIANPIKHFGYSGAGANLYILLHISVFQSCLARVYRCICDEAPEI